MPLIYCRTSERQGTNYSAICANKIASNLNLGVIYQKRISVYQLAADQKPAMMLHSFVVNGREKVNWYCTFCSEYRASARQILFSSSRELQQQTSSSSATNSSNFFASLSEYFFTNGGGCCGSAYCDRTVRQMIMCVILATTVLTCVMFDQRVGLF